MRVVMHTLTLLPNILHGVENSSAASAGLLLLMPNTGDFAVVNVGWLEA
jgi:hypothetical protein